VTSGGDALIEVHLLQLPVPVWAKAQEQTAELQREMTLIAETLRGEAEAAEPTAAPRHLPLRLISLIDSLTADFAGVSMRQDQELEDAASAGRAVIDDLVFHVPAAAAEASHVLGTMLDEADEYCRSGQHLLTLAADDEVVRFRHWYLEQFIAQIAGEPPVAWPDYDGSWPG
jgi:hypothetical protein